MGIMHNVQLSHTRIGAALSSTILEDMVAKLLVPEAQQYLDIDRSVHSWCGKYCKS